MNNIKEYILEKILINKDTELDYSPDDNKRYCLYFDDFKINMPVILDIAGSKIECAFYMIRKTSPHITNYDFYNKDFYKIISLSEEKLDKLFNKRETFTTNTKLGWKSVTYIK